MNPRPITIAHSPDADDAFMFYALAKGRVPTGGWTVTHRLEDIESLNRKAVEGMYEVTALSFHAYSYVQEKYDLMTCGASVGDGYGPIVVSRDHLMPSDLAGEVVAVPGTWTTAFLALRLAIPAARFAVVPFDQIGAAVLSGRFKAGIIIHEGQLTYAGEKLQKVVDLGAWWQGLTRLPLPLGGNGVLRNLPHDEKLFLKKLVHDSVAYSLEHRHEALTHALQYGRGLKRDTGDQFVGMYVNDWTLELGERGRTSITELLDRAHHAKLIPAHVSLRFI